MAMDPNRVVEALRGREDWVDAKYLADALGVTTRTIRTYVRKANEMAGTTLISSSYHGYKLTDAAKDADATVSSGGTSRQEQRTDAILRELISASEPISIYDLSDRHFVSDSTIEADLRQVRRDIAPFGLTMERNRDTVRLEGGEAKKRKLMSRMLANENTGSFTTLTGRGLLHEGYDVPKLTREIVAVLGRHGLKVDDFGLNNLVIHLVVMIERVRHGMQMPMDETSKKTAGTQPAEAAAEICQKAAAAYGLEFPSGEIAFLALVIYSNSRSQDYSFVLEKDLTGLICENDIKLASEATRLLEHTYYLEPFDDNFIMRIAVHIHCLLQRLKNHTCSQNPMLAQIKESYPLVYDMSVFFAQTIAAAANTTMSEDEIAFIAFHIGAYLERSNTNSETVTATFLYMSYHDMHHLTLEKIEEEFKRTLVITSIMSLADYDAECVSTDLVISPFDVSVGKGTSLVVVPPIVRERDIANLRKAINEKTSQRRATKAVSLIWSFLHDDLFRHNYIADKPEDMIRELASEAADKGYAGQEFVSEVLEREKLASTAFGNRLAIPHSMEPSASRSFLSVVANDQPMKWGGHDVNLIILLGISPIDRKLFRTLFDCLTEVLSDPANVMRLAKCSSFDEFADRLGKMLS